MILFLPSHCSSCPATRRVPRQFLAVPVISILIFGAFVMAGVWYRRRSEVHWPMMLLSVFAVIPAAVSRIEPIRALSRDTLWATIFAPFFGTLVMGLVCLRCRASAPTVEVSSRA